jgi:hypothetical protein
MSLQYKPNRTYSHMHTSHFRMNLNFAYVIHIHDAYEHDYFYCINSRAKYTHVLIVIIFYLILSFHFIF